ncbi:MAG TPA: SRPBCC family protein [Myxococcales bacterium]
MARIHGEITIARKVEEVFDFVSDECNEPRYNPQMLSVEKLSPGPIGSGTQFRVQMKSGPPMLLEFTTFERPLRLGSHTSFSKVTIDGELTFEGRGDSTLMYWDWTITPSGALKILTPFIVWMGRRQETRIWSDLKRCLEE